MHPAQQEPRSQLLELRLKRKLTQAQLSVKAGVSLGVIGKLEAPYHVPMDAALRLAEALGVKVEDVDELRQALNMGEK
jgi:transcriptional regulator with XRE-family HTH domain